MKIAYDPISNSENKYVNIMQSVLKNMGNKIVPIRSFLNNDVDVAILNWHEDSPYKKWSYKNALLMIRRCIRLIYAKYKQKKIIYVMHNKNSHDGRIFSRIMRAFLVNVCDIIQIHSRTSIEYVANKYRDKCYYIPHPNYIGEYNNEGDRISRVELGIKEDRIVLLFVGAVKVYKNIELIIEIAKEFPDIEFIIAGKPSPEEYGNELLNSAANTSNIHFVLKFIDDNSIGSYIEIADALILPYNIKSSLNSGSIYLAFSFGKTVVAPLIATLSDLEEYNFFYTYEYTNECEHKECLIKTLKRLVEEYELNNDVLNRKGMEAFEMVKKYHNKDEIENKYVELFHLMGCISK